ncbi:MAG: DUF418 domain-containing protein, partial [Chitinophagaceae bacterium]
REVSRQGYKSRIKVIHIHLHRPLSGFLYSDLSRRRPCSFFNLLGLLIGLPANYFLAKYMITYGGEYWALTSAGLYQTIAYALGVVPLALAYVAALVLIFQKAWGKKWLQVFAPVGKMAFSNYVFQTLVGSIVFLNAGLGYMGKLGPVAYTVFGVGVYIAQIILSQAWLNRFQYGPLEWLWRSATYKKWQSLKRNAVLMPA